MPKIVDGSPIVTVFENIDANRIKAGCAEPTVCCSHDATEMPPKVSGLASLFAAGYIRDDAPEYSRSSDHNSACRTLRFRSETIRFHSATAYSRRLGMSENARSALNAVLLHTGEPHPGFMMVLVTSRPQVVLHSVCRTRLSTTCRTVSLLMAQSGPYERPYFEWSAWSLFIRHDSIWTV